MGVPWNFSILVYIFAPKRSAGSLSSVIKRGLAEIQKYISQLVVEIVNSDKSFVGYLAFTRVGSFSSWMYFFRTYVIMWFML